MNPTPATGTTPQILAPYYGTKPLVQHTRSGRQGHVIGMDKYGVQVFLMDKLEEGAWYWDNCLPVLRPFEQLDKELPDGTIPVVEIAKIILAHQYDAQHHRYDAAGVRAKSSKHGTKWIEVTVPGLHDNLEVAVYENLDLENEDRGMDMLTVLAVLDYLRKNHFATPDLQPHQYIMKEAGK